MANTTRTSFVIMILALLVGTASALVAQEGGQAPSGQAPAGQAQQASSAEGELVKVDVNAKMITVKPATGADLQFTFNEQTKITGARDAAGLATMSGSRVKVSYGANRVATEIAVQPRA